MSNLLYNEFTSGHKAFINAPTIECVYQQPAEKNNLNRYYLVTHVPNIQASFFSYLTITGLTRGVQFSFSNQLNLIFLSNMLFKGSHPMTGTALKVLKKTSKRLLSNTPTTLFKK